MDFDGGSHMFNKPSIESYAWDKMFKRMKAGLCIACGKKTCECRSVGPVDN